MNIYLILDLVFYFFFSIILAPVILGFNQRKKLSQKDLIVLYFLIALLMIQIIGDVFRFNFIRNHFMHYFYSSACLGFSGWYFYKSLYSFQKVILWLVILLFFLILVEGIFIGFNQINSISESIIFIIISVLSFLRIKSIFSNKNRDDIASNSDFWLSLGFFIYSFFSIVTSYFKRQFIESSIELYYFFDTLSVIAHATAFVIFAIGFWSKNIENK